MKFVSKFAALFVAMSLAAFAAPNPQQSFEQLKSLAGVWEWQSPEGKTVEVTYRLMANGSSIVSEINAPGENMISVFHLDKDRLLLTHYCGAGNQPRMQEISADDKTLTFDFVDGTNILPSQMGYMRRLVVTMSDADHHVEQWTFAAKDGKEMNEVFKLTRKK